MFTELLKAKKKYYGKEGWYPEAVKMTQRSYDELDAEAKVLKMGIKQSYSGHSVNGLKIFIDNDQKELFVFGFHHEGVFDTKVF